MMTASQRGLAVTVLTNGESSWRLVRLFSSSPRLHPPVTRWQRGKEEKERAAPQEQMVRWLYVHTGTYVGQVRHCCWLPWQLGIKQDRNR